MKFVCFFNVLFFVFTKSFMAQFYVSPTGSSSGDGSSGNPWDLNTALNHPSAVQPGDTIWLRGGIYKGRFSSKLSGTPSSQIVVRSFPGELATIDGNTTVLLLNTLPVVAPYSGPHTIQISTTQNISIADVIRIGAEDMQVGGISSATDIVVTRGWNGTTPTTHAINDTISLVSPTFSAFGQYTTFMDIEFTDSEAFRERTNNRYNKGTGVNSSGTGIKIINCIIHDNEQGITSFLNSPKCEYYGNIIYNNGFYEKNGSNVVTKVSGHGIYTQNDSSGIKTYEDNMVFNQYGYGFHFYSTNSKLYNFNVKGNIHFNDQCLIGGNNPLVNLNVEENHIWTNGMQIGYDQAINQNITVKNNYFMSGFECKWGKNVVFKNNKVWKPSFGTLSFYSINNQGFIFNKADYTIDSNIYHANDSSPDDFFMYGVNGVADAGYEFYNTSFPVPCWTVDAGFDINSSFIQNSSFRPLGTELVYRPNKYDNKRGHLIIYNWESSPSVKIKLSDYGFNLGDTYTLINAQNYFNEQLTGVYSTDSISLPMNTWTIAEPYGSDSYVDGSTLGSTTFPQFGVFVVKRTPAITTSITKQETPSPQIKLFPNPAKEVFTVKLPKDYQGTYTVSIYNQLGEKMLEKQQTSDNQLTISCTSLSNGVYFVDVETTTWNKREKLLIIK